MRGDTAPSHFAPRTAHSALNHTPILLQEVLRFLSPRPGDVALDCTVGGGGHAQAILDRVQPGGRLIGLDVDGATLRHTDQALRAGGLTTDVVTLHHANFTGIQGVLEQSGINAVDMVLADLGVSTMQADDPRRGFHYKAPGPLDMRMNPESGDTAAELLARVSAAELTTILESNADEPNAAILAHLLKERPITTTQALERTIRLGLAALRPEITKPQLKMSVRRTFQALRIAVNDEFTALDSLLEALPSILKPGGRAVFLTFHSGEDRRVKQAFRAGHRSGQYSDVARTVTRSTMTETRSNRRASSAKLRWAVRADGPPQSAG